jgi:hypothetical protein
VADAEADLLQLVKDECSIMMLIEEPLNRDYQDELALAYEGYVPPVNTALAMYQESYMLERRQWVDSNYKKRVVKRSPWFSLTDKTHPTAIIMKQLILPMKWSNDEIKKLNPDDYMLKYGEYFSSFITYLRLSDKLKYKVKEYFNRKCLCKAFICEWKNRDCNCQVWERWVDYYDNVYYF